VSLLVKRLGDLLKIQNGYAFDSKKFSSEGGMPLIRIRDIKNGLDTETNYIGEYETKYIVKKGDLLIGMDGEFGCYEWKGSKALLNQRVCRLQNFENLIYPRFLLYGINNYLKAIEDITGYITVKHISSKQIADIKFPLPPISIQYKIVEKLDAIFADIDKVLVVAETNFKNAEALFQSYITEVFERGGEKWKKMQIGSISKVINGHAFKSTDFNSDKGVKCLKITNVGIRKFIPDTNEYLPNSFAINHSNFLVNKGAIVIPLTRTIINGGLKVAIVPPDFHNSLLNQRVASIEVMPEIIDSELIYYYLSSSIVKSYVRSHVNTLMQPNLSIKDLLSMPVPIPPLELQLKIKNTISRNIDSISQIKELNIKRTDECNFLKQSILKQAFADELVKAA
jgi:type I restriction enzyme S subunit